MVVNVKKLVKRYDDLIALDHLSLLGKRGRFSVQAQMVRAKLRP